MKNFVKSGETTIFALPDAPGVLALVSGDFIVTIAILKQFTGLPAVTKPEGVLVCANSIQPGNSETCFLEGVFTNKVKSGTLPFFGGEICYWDHVAEEITLESGVNTLIGSGFPSNPVDPAGTARLKIDGTPKVKPIILVIVSPAAGTTRGEGLQVNDSFGVAIDDSTVGQFVGLQVTGEHILPKESTTITTTVGEKLYWDSTPGELTTVAGGNVLIGTASSVQIATDTTAKVILNGVTLP